MEQNGWTLMEVGGAEVYSTAAIPDQPPGPISMRLHISLPVFRFPSCPLEESLLEIP